MLRSASPNPPTAGGGLAAEGGGGASLEPFRLGKLEAPTQNSLTQTGSSLACNSFGAPLGPIVAKRLPQPTHRWGVLAAGGTKIAPKSMIFLRLLPQRGGNFSDPMAENRRTELPLGPKPREREGENHSTHAQHNQQPPAPPRPAAPPPASSSSSSSSTTSTPTTHTHHSCTLSLSLYIYIYV